MPAPVVMAPFGNERAREWPPERFRQLASLLFDRLKLRSVIIGTPHQRTRANEIVRGLPSVAISNLCGTTTWNEVRDMIAHAHCVVVNNSGIAHLAAAMGTRTVCIFGGAHDPTEWHARGPRVMIVRRKVVCSPCMILASTCPNGLACLTEITAEQVFSVIRDFAPTSADSSRDDNTGAIAS